MEAFYGKSHSQEQAKKGSATNGVIAKSTPGGSKLAPLGREGRNKKGEQKQWLAFPRKLKRRK